MLSLVRRCWCSHPSDTAAMTTPTWRRGLAWKDGKLYAFEPNSVLVMRMWPDMLAWRRTKTKPWAATRRHADERLSREFLAPGEMERYALFRTQFGGPIRWDDCFDRMKLDFAAALPAVQTIPDRERGIAARFSDRRWHVLALMARCPGAADLLEANPALGFALANSWVLKRSVPTQPMRAARSILQGSQVDILEWLDLPASERVRRILRKIEPDALKGQKLPLLQRALWLPKVQAMLAHLPCINSDVIQLLQDQDSVGRLTPRFLLDILEPVLRFNELDHKPSHPAISLWSDAIRMARAIRAEPPTELRSFAHLVRWHDEVVQDYNRHLEQVGRVDRRPELGPEPLVDLTFAYGPPPFDGTSQVRPILSYSDLLKEGQDLEHCVASYHHQIAAGSYFVYKVESPVRATLGLQLQHRSWRVDQVFGHRNRKVPATVQDELLESLFKSSAADRDGEPMQPFRTNNPS
jgi:hypothetical protein